ncbi:MAG: DUF4143 domain-containing protein [Propionibacteriaceae bacterium]|nr:DUF4143 domain-containing protein [Propionibacteriaceae bacterium]
MTDYVPRLLDNVLPELLSNLTAVSLVGPRACGKTTTAMRYATSVVRLNRHDDATLFRADPSAALDRLEPPVLLDEWQEVPEVLDAIKERVDTDPTPGRFILTGSISAAIQKTWAGTGRVTRIPTYPLTRREINHCVESDSFLDRVARNALDQLPPGPAATITDYIAMAAQGGLPESALRLQGRSRLAWLRGYLAELLSRDIATAGGDPDITKLASYVDAMAAVSGCVVDEATLLDASGIGRKTASRYQALLESVFFTDRVPAWWSNRLTRLTALPKRFVIDTALLMTVLRVSDDTVLKDSHLLGRILETFVAMQIRPELPLCDTQPSWHHLRDHGGRHEVDFVLEYGQGRLVGLEVKAGAAPDISDARHLIWLRDQIGDAFLCGVVLHTGKYSFRLSDRIYAAPISTIWA